MCVCVCVFQVTISLNIMVPTEWELGKLGTEEIVESMHDHTEHGRNPGGRINF